MLGIFNHHHWKKIFVAPDEDYRLLVLYHTLFRFPKIDEEFMANYQINYGFTKDGVAEPTRPSEEEAKPAVVAEQVEAKKKKKTEAEKEAAWFEEEESKSTKVYVSNLPTSITEESFVEFMSKCGMVEFDVRTKKPKVKIYRDEEGSPKGDGRRCPSCRRAPR